MGGEGGLPVAHRWSVPPLSATGALLAIALLAPGLGPVSGAIPDLGDDRDQRLPEHAGVTLTTVARLFEAGEATVSGTVTCPLGRVVGGGFQASSDVVITLSYPSAPDQWQVAGHSLSGTRPIFAWAVCMSMEPGAVIGEGDGL